MFEEYAAWAQAGSARSVQAFAIHLSSYKTLRLSRQALAKSVAPARLIPTLQSLVDAGALAGFSEVGNEVLVWGDLTALEVALERAEVNPPDGDTWAMWRGSVLNGDQRADYFRAADRFTHRWGFRRLSSKQRAIWRLHAAGLTRRRIQLELGVTLEQVRLALHAGRLAAGLPRTVSNMPRGGDPYPGLPKLRQYEGRYRRLPDAKCASLGCPNPERRWGLCNTCSQAAWLRWRRAERRKVG